ncbi:hypothetical protein [Halorientalis marina]|uniref:hypothetical protein n=1 Tax=Halorientalis marina TaxID=2931976 RepID=UPI001FF5C595|nr:hypothetical protein [Halorientalis marina]
MPSALGEFVLSGPAENMAIQTEATDGQQTTFKQVTATESRPDSQQIRAAVQEQVSDNSSLRTIRDRVLKTLCQQVPGLGVADIHDLRVSLDIDVDADAPVDAQVSSIL